MNSGLPYGAVGRLIYQCLGSKPVGTDASVSEVFYYCCNLSGIVGDSGQKQKFLLRSVRKQLKSFAYKGKTDMTFAGTNFKYSRYVRLVID